jgi:hypothetical protein
MSHLLLEDGVVVGDEAVQLRLLVHQHPVIE